MKKKIKYTCNCGVYGYELCEDCALSNMLSNRDCYCVMCNNIMKSVPGSPVEDVLQIRPSLSEYIASSAVSHPL
jgi:hypothetical protein